MPITANKEASVVNHCQDRHRSLVVLNRMVLLCSSKLLFSQCET
jgi:hypothetical protein